MAATGRSRMRARLWLLARVLGTSAGFGYIAFLVEPADLTRAFSRTPPSRVLLASGLFFCIIGLSALRWRCLMIAYQAPRLLPWSRLARYYLVALFYNTCLPGGVTGDVVRAVLAREAFGRAGTTAGLAVVAVERLSGLCALLLVVSLSLAIRPPPGLPAIGSWTALGLVGAVSAVALLSAAPRLARGRLSGLAEKIPSLGRPVYLVWALGFSLSTLACYAMAGYLLLAPFAADITFPDALVIVPMAAAATFLPITVGGAGVREAALVALSTLTLDISRPDAAAASLALWGSNLVVAGVGGLVSLRQRVEDRE